MTVYVHFHIHTGRDSVRLFNVRAIEDSGLESITIKMQFTDDVKEFDHVSHVAVQPEQE